jgi:hypothetical protein
MCGYLQDVDRVPQSETSTAKTVMKKFANYSRNRTVDVAL